MRCNELELANIHKARDVRQRFDTFLTCPIMTTKDRERDRSEAFVNSLISRDDPPAEEGTAIILQTECRRARTHLLDKSQWWTTHDKGALVMVSFHYQSVLPLWVGSASDAKSRIRGELQRMITPRMKLTIDVSDGSPAFGGYYLAIYGMVPINDESSQDDAAIEKDIEKQVKEASAAFPNTTR